MSVPKSDNAEDYKLCDKVAGGYRTMKVYDDQSEVYRSERAEHKDIRFIYGPRLVKIYASAGLENPTSNQNLENQEDGNGFIKYTFIATIEKAETVCHDVSIGSIESSNTLDYNDARFYSVRVDQFETLGFTYAQMVVDGNVNVQASPFWLNIQCTLITVLNTFIAARRARRRKRASKRTIFEI